VSLYKDAKAAGTDLYKITKEISGFIGQFFDAHEEVKKDVKRQELDPPKTKSMKAQALENTDPALGAVWSRFEEEYKKLNEENERQIELDRQLEMQRKWQRRKKAQQSARQGANNRGSSDAYYIPPPPPMVNQTDDNGQIVFLISLIAVMLILPLFLYLMASMYFDMLVLQQENKQHQAIIRRLITQLEEKK
jgi:hypothetical protein